MEIRNIAPNATTSFGMALRKPKPDQIEQFTDYVTKGRNINLVKRGIIRVRKEQAGNPHFDIVYRTNPAHPEDNIFTVEPISDKAKSMFEKIELLSNVGSQSKAAELRAKGMQDIKIAENDSIGRIRQGLHVLKALCRLVQSKIYIQTHPEDVLPRNLRYANELATSQAKAVEEQLANERAISETLS